MHFPEAVSASNPAGSIFDQVWPMVAQGGGGKQVIKTDVKYTTQRVIAGESPGYQLDFDAEYVPAVPGSSAGTKGAMRLAVQFAMGLATLVYMITV